MRQDTGTAEIPSTLAPVQRGAEPNSRRSRARSIMDRRFPWSLGAMILLVGLWHAATSAGLANARYVGTPLGVWKAGWDLVESGRLIDAAAATFAAFLMGMGISVGLGIPAGLIMGWNRPVRRLTEPLMMILYVTPYLALMPLILLWVGFGTSLSVTVAVFASIVPLVINAMAGVRTVDPVIVRAGRAFGANGIALFRKVVLPASIPSILTGIRLGIGRALLGVIVAEMYVSTQGLGQLVTRYGLSYRTDYVIFLFVFIGTFGYVISAVGRRIEAAVARRHGA